MAAILQEINPPQLDENVMCSVVDCERMAAHGAHVHSSSVTGKEDMLCIVPTCAQHNPVNADKRIGCIHSCQSSCCQSMADITGEAGRRRLLRWLMCPSLPHDE